MVNIQEQQSSPLKWPILVIVLVIVSLILYAIFSSFGRGQGQFRPQVSPLPSNGLVNSEPIALTFSDLDANPLAYRNKLVRVAGNYTRLSPVVCTPFKGPRPRWGLVAEGFQMDMVGLNEIIDLAPEGATLTVDGVWRLYEGPLGCGKEPSSGSAWYLEARRIVQPNPLIFNGMPSDPSGETITPSVGLEPTPTITGTVPTGEPEEEEESIIDFETSTPDPAGLTPTIPIASTTPTLTPTSIRVTATATPTRPNQGGGNNNTTTTPTTTASPTPTGTVGPGTPQPTNEALPTSPSGTVIPATLGPSPTPGSYAYP